MIGWIIAIVVALLAIFGIGANAKDIKRYYKIRKMSEGRERQQH
jgi:hypothetical protein